jgi:tRNA threonylcarbamoyladenosine biosynthesis protein TsaE
MMQPAPAPAPPTATHRLELADEAATAAFATRLAAALGPGTVIWLSGGLGAGKTTLVRGVLRALGHTGKVRSPTFTLLEPYNLARFPVYHFDFYRFSSANEWRDAGFDEYFRSDGACLVEWPDLAGPDLPRPELALRLGFADGDAGGTGTARVLEIDAFGNAGLRCLNVAVAAS